MVLLNEADGMGHVFAKALTMGGTGAERTGARGCAAAARIDGGERGGEARGGGGQTARCHAGQG